MSYIIRWYDENEVTGKMIQKLFDTAHLDHLTLAFCFNVFPLYNVCSTERWGNHEYIREIS